MWMMALCVWSVQWLFFPLGLLGCIGGVREPIADHFLCFMILIWHPSLVQNLCARWSFFPNGKLLHHMTKEFRKLLRSNTSVDCRLW
jgi:hypothetical protein